MDLELRDLRMVTAIAASGSVTRAAGDLHRTQSAISHQLRAIEERLGTPLFLRVGKRMVVTAAGELVLATARRVLDDIRATEEDVRRLAGHVAGERDGLSVGGHCGEPVRDVDVRLVGLLREREGGGAVEPYAREVDVGRARRRLHTE